MNIIEATELVRTLAQSAYYGDDKRVFFQGAATPEMSLAALKEGPPIGVALWAQRKTERIARNRWQWSYTVPLIVRAYPHVEHIPDIETFFGYLDQIDALLYQSQRFDEAGLTVTLDDEEHETTRVYTAMFEIKWSVDAV